MTISKLKKALAAATIATALTGTTMASIPVDFSSPTVVHAATSSISFSKIDAAIAKYNALQETDYTATSWQVLHQSIDTYVRQMAAMVTEMKTMSDAEIEEDGATISAVQVKLDDFASDLSAAIDQILVKKSEIVTLDFTAINAAIARYKGLKEADYTPETWAAFQSNLVYEDGTPVDMAAYIFFVEELQALSGDELVYLLRETGINAADLQNELNQNASALNTNIDLLVGTTVGATVPFSGGLPTTYEAAPTSAVAKTNLQK